MLSGRTDQKHVRANYGLFRFLGNCVLGATFAVLPTAVIYKAWGSKQETLVVFFPFAILFTRLWYLVWDKTGNRDEERRRAWFRATSRRM